MPPPKLWLRPWAEIAPGVSLGGEEMLDGEDEVCRVPDSSTDEKAPRGGKRPLVLRKLRPGLLGELPWSRSTGDGSLVVLFASEFSSTFCPCSFCFKNTRNVSSATETSLKPTLPCGLAKRLPSLSDDVSRRDCGRCTACESPSLLRAVLCRDTLCLTLAEEEVAEDPGDMIASLDLVNFIAALLLEGGGPPCDTPLARRSASAVPEIRSVGAEGPSEPAPPPLEPDLVVLDMRSDPVAM